MKKVFAPFKITEIQKAAIFIVCIGLFGILIYMNVKPDFPVFIKKDVRMTETFSKMVE